MIRKIAALHLLLMMGMMNDLVLLLVVVLVLKRWSVGLMMDLQLGWLIDLVLVSIDMVGLVLLN